MAHIRGWQQMKSNLHAIARGFPDQVGKALLEEMKVELREAQKRTPVDTGALQSTVRLDGPYQRGNRIYVLLIAGGEAIEFGVVVDYGIYVHEDLDAFHEFGQAKFISSVLNESASTIMQRVAARLKRRNFRVS